MPPLESRVAEKAVSSRSPSVVPVTAGGSGKETPAPPAESQKVAEVASVVSASVPKPVAAAASEVTARIEGAAAQSSPSLGSAEAEESKYY